MKTFIVSNTGSPNATLTAMTEREAAITFLQQDKGGRSGTIIVKEISSSVFAQPVEFSVENLLRLLPPIKPHKIPMKILNWLDCEIPSYVEEALRNGTDVNARDNRGFTALYHCAAQGSPDGVKNLLDFAADPRIASQQGTTPLEVAKHNMTAFASGSTENDREQFESFQRVVQLLQGGDRRQTAPP